MLTYKLQKVSHQQHVQQQYNATVATAITADKQVIHSVKAFWMCFMTNFGMACLGVNLLIRRCKP